MIEMQSLWGSAAKGGCGGTAFMYQRPEGRMFRHRRAVFGALAIFLLLATVLVIAHFAFAVRAIEVRGNHLRSTEEVIAASGIQMGESIITIKPEEVRERINGNRYLEFVSLIKRYASGTVTLMVSERAPYAKLMWMGHLVLLGENGVVLENTHHIDMAVNVPEIIGMTVNNARVGDEITYAVSGQGEAVTQILDALYAQGIANEIAGINVSLMNNLTMVTYGQLEIILGGDENLADKVTLVREVLPRIQAAGYQAGGTLIVSSGIRADFRPPQQ